MTIVSNGQVFVVSGGIAVGLIVEKGGSVIARTGGITSGAVLSGGDEYVSSGSQALSTSVHSGGALFISSGGLASAAKVGTDAAETVSSGGSDVYAVVLGGTQNLDGGTASNTTLKQYAIQNVISGIASATRISNGSEQNLSAGGESIDARVSGGGFQYVSSGAESISATILDNGLEVVLSGGTAERSIVRGGTASLGISSGGVDFKSTIDAGFEGVLDGGKSYETQVKAGAEQNIFSGGIASAAILFGGQIVSSGGLAISTQVSSGGAEAVFGGVARGTEIEGGSMLVADGTAINPLFDKNPGGSLTLDSGSVVSGSITFAINAATLSIESKIMPTAVISGFAPTDIINLAAVRYSNTDTVSTTGNEASLITPTGTYILDIAGASNDTFEVLKASTGTNLEVTNTGAPTLAGLRWQAMISPEDRASLNPGPFVMSAIIHGAASIIPETSVPPSMMILNHE